MFIVTGGAGFIGSVLISFLNEQGVDDIVIVDALGSEEKWKNLRKKKFRDYIDKSELLPALEQNAFGSIPEAIIHLGACSSTLERDVDYLMRNNVAYSQQLIEYAVTNEVRLIYASSAATYGAGERGYSDSFTPLEQLLPLNPYGFSKNRVDCWVEQQFPRACVGLKFFNVYGPNEYHKGSMKSVVNHAFHQIQNEKKVKLFRSYRDEYCDGEQKRDFVYVKDCAKIIWWLCQHPEVHGLFNVATGNARTWNDLARAVVSAMNQGKIIHGQVPIEYIEMPEAMRAQYQYFTEGPMDKLRAAGYEASKTSLEDGVNEYVIEFLSKSDPYC